MCSHSVSQIFFQIERKSAGIVGWEVVIKMADKRKGLSSLGLYIKFETYRVLNSMWWLLKYDLEKLVFALVYVRKRQVIQAFYTNRQKIDLEHQITLIIKVLIFIVNYMWPDLYFCRTTY